MDDNTTVLKDRLPNAKWKCPHCGKINKMAPTAEEKLEDHLTYTEACHWCGYLHFWELHISDELKKKVLDLFS